MKPLFLMAMTCLLHPVQLQETPYFKLSFSCDGKVVQGSVELVNGIKIASPEPRKTTEIEEQPTTPATEATGGLSLPISTTKVAAPEIIETTELEKQSTSPATETTRGQSTAIFTEEGTESSGEATTTMTSCTTNNNVDCELQADNEATSSTSSIAKSTPTAIERTTVTLHTPETIATAPSITVSSTLDTKSAAESMTVTTPCKPDRNVNCEKQNHNDTCQILCSYDCGDTCFSLWYKRQPSERSDYQEANKMCSDRSSKLANFTSVAQFTATARVVWEIIDAKGWPFHKSGIGNVDQWGSVIWTGMIKNEKNEIISNDVRIDLDWDYSQPEDRECEYIGFRLKPDDNVNSFPIPMHDLAPVESLPGVLCQLG